MAMLHGIYTQMVLIMIRLLSPVTISERNMGIADRRTNERLFTHIEYMNDNEAIKYNVKINNGPVNGNVKSSTLDTATRNALDSFMAIGILSQAHSFPSYRKISGHSRQRMTGQSMPVCSSSSSQSVSESSVPAKQRVQPMSGSIFFIMRLNAVAVVFIILLSVDGVE